MLECQYDLFTLRKMDEDCFTACINEITSKWLTNLPSLYEETYNKLIETSKYKYNCKIVYKNYYSNPGYGISRFGTIIHKYNNESFSICQDSELSSELTEELRQKGLTYISNGFSLDSFLCA